MSQPEILKKQLYKFAAHIRDPENQPAPENIEDRRLGIYRDLFFNNVDGFLSNTFPVLKSLYDDEPWTELARSFYTKHRCQSPYFLEISREFIDYLQSEHQIRDIDGGTERATGYQRATAPVRRSCPSTIRATAGST